MQVLSKRTIEKGPLVYEIMRVVDEDCELKDDVKGTRLSDYVNGIWTYIGVVVDIRVNTATQWFIPHKVGSASLWGIESDSDEAYLADVEKGLIEEAEEDLGLTFGALRDAVRAKLVRVKLNGRKVPA